ncbi:MAG: tyrosine-type recombinase/integrase, partial [Clostridia bacterium]|nr:tyrosine-type recombinase/integrase [Clostridia bacterium]MDY5555299.1 tyrosine-type recombinase/integrase [Blautia sp.]
TGMRVGELSGLKWEDINFLDDTITVCRSEKYSRLKKEYYISTTKNDKVRILPLTKEMKDVLRRVKKKEMEGGYLCEFVFSNEKGRVHARTISDCARNNTMTEEFVNTKSIHAIRRTLNSNLRCEGVPTPIAASILGHVEKVNENNYTYDVSSMDTKRGYIEKAGKIS